MIQKSINIAWSIPILNSIRTGIITALSGTRLKQTRIANLKLFLRVTISRAFICQNINNCRSSIKLHFDFLQRLSEIYFSGVLLIVNVGQRNVSNRRGWFFWSGFWFLGKDCRVGCWFCCGLDGYSFFFLFDLASDDFGSWIEIREKVQKGISFILFSFWLYWSFRFFDLILDLYILINRKFKWVWLSLNFLNLLNRLFMYGNLSFTKFVLELNSLN